jgi:biopolymer transport protein ExbB
MNDTNTPESQPFGLMNLWSQGDGVTRTVAIILLLMSIASWIIIISRAFTLWKVLPLVNEINNFWQKPTLGESIESLSNKEINPFFNIAKVARDITTEHALQTNSIKQAFVQADWLERSLKAEVDASISQLQKGLAYLASTGATAPFIGLFGTVWGIYHALMSISNSGSASIDQVAGPIGEALIMTALGLAVAIPAVLGYNALSKTNRSLLAELRRFADDIHTYIGQIGKTN